MSVENPRVTIIVTKPVERVPGGLTPFPILHDTRGYLYERNKVEKSEQARQMFRNAIDSYELRKAMEPQYVKDLLEDAFLQKEDPAMTQALAHSLRVALIVGDIHEYYFSLQSLVLSAQRGAILHDIGKAENPAIPSSVLLKKEKLTPKEFSGIQTHPEVGYQRARSHTSHEPAVALDIKHHHCCQGERSYHERIDDDDMSPEAQRLRILAIGDTIESLLDKDRDYDRKGKVEWSSERIFTELKAKFGKAFPDDLYKFAISAGVAYKDRFTARSKVQAWG